MATALVSLLTKQRITPLIAMTGEITLSGNVLPVGGIKEKVLAAKRAGVRDVILPAENKMNVEEDLTPEQLENLSVHYVKTIDEALRISLPQVAEGPAARIIPAIPPKDPKQDYNPTEPIKEPEPVHDRVLTQA
jgi:ATP-dependent Lon protease